MPARYLALLSRRDMGIAQVADGRNASGQGTLLEFTAASPSKGGTGFVYSGINVRAVNGDFGPGGVAGGTPPWTGGLGLIQGRSLQAPPVLGKGRIDYLHVGGVDESKSGSELFQKGSRRDV